MPLLPLPSVNTVVACGFEHNAIRALRGNHLPSGDGILYSCAKCTNRFWSIGLGCRTRDPAPSQQNRKSRQSTPSTSRLCTGQPSYSSKLIATTSKR